MTKIRPRQTPDQLRTPCWCPNHHKAMQQRVSNPDCADGARPHSRREQHPQSTAPSLVGGESPLRAPVLASSFSATPSLTVNRLNQIFRQFFVSLNGPASGRSNGGNQIPRAKAVRIGANDARHREHLMAPARQLTSSASLKSKSCGAKPCLLKSDRSSREPVSF